MTTTFPFNGLIDLTKLSLSQIADATGALATLQRLQQEGVIEFSATTRVVEQPSTYVKRPTQQTIVLNIITEAKEISFGELLSRTNIKEGSLSSGLHSLIKLGLITKHKPPTQFGKTRMNDIIYKVNEQ